MTSSPQAFTYILYLVLINVTGYQCVLVRQGWQPPVHILYTYNGLFSEIRDILHLDKMKYIEIKHICIMIDCGFFQWGRSKFEAALPLILTCINIVPGLKVHFLKSIHKCNYSQIYPCPNDGAVILEAYLYTFTQSAISCQQSSCIWQLQLFILAWIMCLTSSYLSNIIVCSSFVKYAALLSVD